jgi:hypothetical protein
VTRGYAAGKARWLCITQSAVPLIVADGVAEHCPALAQTREEPSSHLDPDASRDGAEAHLMGIASTSLNTETTVHAREATAAPA